MMHVAPMGLVTGSVLACPVDGCSWSIETQQDKPRTFVLEGTSQQAIHEAVARVVKQEAAETEAAIRAHLETHDLLDFMRTIHRLRMELDDAVRRQP